MAEALPTLIGDYQVEALLGEGGMAKVYRARHTVLDTQHALKVLNPELRVNPEARRRFLDEARIQAKHLDHPNIVKVTSIVATADHAALVMELIDGGSLEAALPELGKRLDRVVPIMLGVLDGMAHAHAAGVIHRDLKPSNVLLARVGDRVVPKLTDFGIAKVTAELAGKGKKSTQGSARMGTLGYMSPEQIRGAKQVTVRSDVFALGAILYELATGTPAFDGDSEYDVMERIVNGRYEPPERTYAGVTPAIAAVIRQALAADPAARFASCEEMAAALRAAAGAPAYAAPSPSPSPNPGPNPSPSSHRSRPWLVAGLVAAGAALGGTAVYLAVTANASEHEARAATAHDAGTTTTATSTTDAGTLALAALTPGTTDPAPSDPRPGADAIDDAIDDDIDAGTGEPALAAPAVVDPGPPDPLAAGPGSAVLDPLVAPHPCIGSWAGDVGARMTITDGESCGRMKWKMCSGPLIKCQWSDGKLRARYRCTGPDYHSVGTMRFTCTDKAMTVVDKDDEFDHSVTNRFRRR